MEKYVLIEENVESRTADIISEAYENGLQNGYYKVLFETESLEAARAELAKHTISVSSFRTAGGKRYEACLIYLEQQEYNENTDEWETDWDSLEFAKIVNFEEEEE